MSNQGVSVCLAAYNGRQHIHAQLESILAEIGASDEVIVVDDCSTDGTPDVVRNISDCRVRLYRNDTNRGHVAAFERAIALASRSTILLADQDDVWVPGRCRTMVRALESYSVVASNHSTFAGSVVTPAPLRFTYPGPRGRWTVLFTLLAGRGPYFGCAMGLTAEARDLALPFPNFVEAHDHWLALVGARLGGIYAIDTDTVLRRLHASNLTARSRRPLWGVLATRMKLMQSVFVLILRSLNRRICE